MQYRNAMSIAKPVVPLRNIDPLFRDDQLQDSKNWIFLSFIILSFTNCSCKKDLGENVHIIAHGTILEEFRISSLICTAPSAPEKANMGVISPIIKVIPLLSYPPSARKCVQTSPLLLFWGDMTVNTTITMTNSVI
jgi:hypothetical protein